MRTALVLALCVIAVRMAAAATGGAGGVVVRVWQSQDGLPSNVVRSVVQASDGYLWVATAEGVARFDGFDFQTIEVDRDMRRYRLAFSRLFATSGGVVWAATYQGGLFRVRGSRLEPLLEDIRRPNPPLVTQVVEAPDGEIWLRRGKETMRVIEDRPVVVEEPGADAEGLLESDLRSQAASGRRASPDDAPSLTDASGRRWQTGADGGLTISEDGREAITVEFPQRGPVFGINEMMRDSEGNVWVASQVNGLARIRQARVIPMPVDPLASEQAYPCLLEDRAGVWWIADRKGGLIRWSGGEARHFDLSTSRVSRPAAALFEDRDARLWVASRDGSVFLWDGRTFQPQFLRTQVPSKVRSIAQDAGGTLWFGGTQGLASYDGSEVRRYGREEGVGEVEVTVVTPFPGGGMIAGTAAGVVLLGNGRSFTHLGDPDALGYQWVSGILPVSADEVWVTTQGAGLWLWDGRKWLGFGPDDGLPDARLTCVLDDGRGNCWLGSLGGIIRVARAELRARAKNPAAPVHWLRLDHTDGLPSRECLGGYQPAGWRARDGHLWFPTGGGLVRIRPDLIERNNVPPPVILQSVRANGVTCDADAGMVTTDPGRARLEFRFVGLGFSAPEKTTYRARLRGLNDAWTELGDQRIAAFEAVPPGRYTFEVLAVNGDGTVSREPAGIGVIVTPHWWETAWFYLVAGAFALATAGGIGWFGARVRLKRRIQALKIRHAREAERARIARDLHDDLGADLTEISILAALAAEDAGQSPLHAPLDQLSNKAKHAVTSLDEIVWAVNPREDNLRSLVEYLAAFAREFLDLARVALRTDVAADLPELPLPSTIRHGVFLAAREALNNIVKHARASEVRLTIRIDNGVLDIRVADNGRGYDPDEHPAGNGLGNLRARMLEAGGDCRIDTTPGGGTTVHLSLPLPVAG